MGSGRLAWRTRAGDMKKNRTLASFFSQEVQTMRAMHVLKLIVGAL